MQTIHLDANMVPASLRGGYSGKMFKARVCESVTIPMDAGLWSGGSRETYRVVRLADGAEIEPLRDQSPWDRARRDISVTLEPGIAVICHSMFCGKDHGLTFYVHPSNAAQLLPAPSAELTDHEKIVLTATRSYKSSYGGKDRYEMAQGDYRYGDKAHLYPTRAQWDAAKQSLIGKGLLNKAGAITTAGKNAIPSRY